MRSINLRIGTHFQRINPKYGQWRYVISGETKHGELHFLLSDGTTGKTQLWRKLEVVPAGKRRELRVIEVSPAAQPL